MVEATHTRMHVYMYIHARTHMLCVFMYTCLYAYTYMRMYFIMISFFRWQVALKDNVFGFLIMISYNYFIMISFFRWQVALKDNVFGFLNRSNHVAVLCCDNACLLRTR